MLTLENLISKLKEFTTNHQILKSWYFGSQLNKLPDYLSIEYPMMFGTLKPSKLGPHTDRTVITLFISDRVLKDKSNELNVWSDCKQIAKDALTYLKKTSWLEPLIITEEIDLDFYTDADDDEVSGVSFDIELKTVFEWNLCSVPIAGAPIQPNNYASYITDTNGNILAILSPGEFYITTANMTPTLETYTFTGDTQTTLHNALFVEGLYWGGQWQTPGVDYSYSGNTITCLNTGRYTGETLSIVYKY